MPFEALLKNDTYQVFLFTCPASVPVNFVRHPWFVINQKGKVERWEVFFRPDPRKEHWGHLHRNAFLPTQGIPVLYPWEKFLWKGRIEGYIEGGEGSLAHQMAKVIASSPQTYPHLNHYALTGINSNTYARWVLNQFPNSGLKLPWNALGTTL